MCRSAMASFALVPWGLLIIFAAYGGNLRQNNDSDSAWPIEQGLVFARLSCAAHWGFASPAATNYALRLRRVLVGACSTSLTIKVGLDPKNFLLKIPMVAHCPHHPVFEPSVQTCLEAYRVSRRVLI